MYARMLPAVAMAAFLASPAIAQTAATPATSETASPAPATPGIAIPGTALTLTSTAAATTDYLFRGISQTRNRPAAQGTFDLAHDSGFYVGAFVSNATFLGNPYNDTRQELDLLAGYRFTIGNVSLDLGYVAYLYPGQTKPPGTQLNEYQEVALRASSQVTEALKLSAAFNWSPNFFGRSGNGYYVEGGADLSLPLGFTAFGRVGYQWIQNNPRFGTPDYLWYGVGVQREVILGMTLAVGWYGTNISQRECAPVAERADAGQKICDSRVLVTLSRVF
ncbi:MAG: TorF family putative porin [Hyphomicrobiaceae bacterium]|nr:TorF family putative porin [Hyphomicrobiaceae bacterium]